jgi:hypothetical protein
MSTIGPGPRGPRKPTPTIGRNYIEIEGGVFCFPSFDHHCFGAKFAVAQKLSPFHDAELQQCTKEINALLAGVKKKKPGRELCTLLTPKGLFLAWTSHDAVSAYDDEAKLNKALGLK